MANYHILEQAADQKTIQVVFHIPIPAAGTNEAGHSWRDAMVLSFGGSGNIQSVLPNISTEEDTKIKAGELLEYQHSLRFSKLNLTPAEKKIEIENAFNNLKTSILAEKQITLAWIGYSGDVT